MKKILLSVFFLAPGFWTQAVEPPASVSVMAKAFELVMNHCPERLWKADSFHRLSILFLYPSTKSAYRWVQGESQVEEHDFPDYGITGFYNVRFKDQSGQFKTVPSFQDRAILSLNMDSVYSEETLSRLLLMGIHEGFHFTEQMSWPGGAPSQSMNKGSAYPKESEPHYMRAMLFQNMSQYLRTKSTFYLQQAKYWHNRWQSRFPEEAELDLDRREGTASYAELFGMALFKYGCSVKKERIIEDYLQNIIFQDWRRLSRSDMTASSYVIGGLATLILSLTEINPEWKEEIQKGQSPVNVLLAGYESRPQEDDERIHRGFQRIVQKENKLMGQVVDQDIHDFADPTFIRVSLPLHWGRAQLSSWFFLAPRGLNDVELFPLSREHTYEDSTTLSFITLNQNKVVFIDKNQAPYPCQKDERRAFTLVHGDYIERSLEGGYKVKSPSVYAYFFAEPVVRDGYLFLCPQ